MGWQSSVFTLLIVEAGQPGTGLFVYNGAPGPGNPPIFWASGAAVDPFGNALPGTAGVEGSGTFIVGTAPNTQLASAGGVGVLRFLLNSASFGNGLLESAILSGFAQVLLNGPGAVAAGHTDFVGTEYNSSDGTHSANWTLIYTDANGAAYTTAFGDWTGFNIPAGSVTAVEPGTGTSAVNAAVPEFWHAPSLPGGWRLPRSASRPRMAITPRRSGCRGCSSIRPGTSAWPGCRSVSTARRSALTGCVSRSTSELSESTRTYLFV